MSEGKREVTPGDEAAAQPDYDRVIRTCPVCSKELEERKCKLICTDPRCGYYMSCADFY